MFNRRLESHEKEVPDKKQADPAAELKKSPEPEPLVEENNDLPPPKEKPSPATGQSEVKTDAESPPAQPRKIIPGTVPSIKDALNGVSRTAKEDGKNAGGVWYRVANDASR